MAINDRFSLQFEGDFCGSLFSWNFSYQQIAANLPGENPGLSLANGWLQPLTGPWFVLRNYLSAELRLICANWSSGDNVGSAALTGASNMGGDGSTPPMPPTVAIMFHEWAVAPHEDNFAGRFYLNGLTTALVDGPGLNQAMVAALAPFNAAVITITPPGAPGGMFRMIPSLDFVKNVTVPTGSSEFVGVVFQDPLLRRIRSRLPDHCAIVSAQGAPPSMPEIEITDEA